MCRFIHVLGFFVFFGGVVVWGGWRGGGLLVLSWFTGCVSFYRCFKVCVGLCVFWGGLGGLLLLFGGGWRVGDS